MKAWCCVAGLGCAFLFDLYSAPDQNVQRGSTVYQKGEEGIHTYRIPSLLVTDQRTLLAISEARKNGSGDSGNINLVVKRSTDEGHTWSAMRTIWNDGGNTCGNPCPVLDRKTGTIWLAMTWNRGTDVEGSISQGKSRDSRRVFISSSRDDGLTWSIPLDITANVKATNWTWYATGPGVGIQIEHGRYQGRLVIPCDHNEAVSNRRYSHVFYSDDHGRSWKLGGTTPKDGVNECEVVELTEGRLMLNMRNYDRTQKTRQSAISLDGGGSWTDQQHVPELIEPVCQASIRRVSWPEGTKNGVIAFSNPASLKRERMTIRFSFDDGKTWPESRLIDPRPSAYSCLAVLPSGGLGLLYEAGDRSPYETVLFSRIPPALISSH